MTARHKYGKEAQLLPVKKMCRSTEKRQTSPLSRQEKQRRENINPGSGYISWAMRNYGGYSELNALEFSAIMAQRLGWPSYGDPYYVQHVLRYYNPAVAEND